MKSYKDTTRSYKDLDKEIILNAPEGAMWVEGCNYYYKLQDGVLYYNPLGREWRVSAYESYQEVIKSLQLIPLPNIEIPWEATADSECPVPDGFEVKVTLNTGYTITDDDPEGWTWSTISAPIMAYKIIDEDYLKPAQEAPIHVPELEMHRAAYQAIKNAGFESPEELLAQHKCLLDKVADASEEKLTKRLKFLQNLANQFPEIRNEAIKFMECELDGYMNTLWEKDNDE